MEEYTTKACTKCKIVYPVTYEYFARDKRTRDGHGSWCRKCQNNNSKKYYDANTQKINAYWKEWRSLEENKKKIKLRKHEYHENNKEIIHLKKREYHKAHSAEICEKVTRWNKENPERHQIHVKRRKFKQRQLLSTLSHQEWEDIKAEFGYRCAYCGKAWFEIEGVLAQDHIIPVAQGGEYVRENIVPACKNCNSKKHAKTPEQAGMPIRWPEHSTNG